MHIRKNQRNLTSAEKKRFVSTVLQLKRQGGYDEFVRQHVQYYRADGDDGPRAGHMAPSFLPWHRKYLLEFERALQRIDPKVTVPYWDWTTDNTPAASLWSEDFLGGDGRSSDGQVTTGAFAYAAGNWNINDGVLERKFLARAFGRPASPIALPTKAELAWAMDESVYDAAPWDSTVTRGFRNRLEGWTAGSDKTRWRNHNRVHRWVGGQMLGATAPHDPVFWLHHAFVDLLWDRWQQKHPKSTYLPQRRLDDDDPQHGRAISLDEPMPPWRTKPSQMLSHQSLYRYDA
ncbi:tyrosinase family protein [Streptomyces niveus]|uniref:Tyrosinase family protein n=1 Tax=Streptomyces niveus TaxID=193462 RepID=A0ABZ1ZVH3_STRNV|nr:tyrosinase family protein [Streptomyces niveus]